MKTLTGATDRHQKAGGWEALYVALAYIVAMPYFLLYVNESGVKNPADKVSLLVSHHASLQALYLFIYVIFGIVLAVLALTLHRRLKDGAPVLAQVATAAGLIWAVMLVASGLVYNAGLAAVVGLHGTDAAQAVSVWQAVEPIAQGLGGAGGELLGGLWVLLLSVAGLRTKTMPRSLDWLGVALGAIGVLSVVPALRELAYGFGLLQIVWFVWLGIVMIRARSRTSVAQVIVAPANA